MKYVVKCRTGWYWNDSIRLWRANLDEATLFTKPQAIELVTLFQKDPSIGGEAKLFREELVYQIMES